MSLKFDDETARKLVAIYSTPDVVAQRRATLERLSLSPGEAVLDVGCGPGLLCRDMAVAVGSTGRVEGIDISDDLLAWASQQNDQEWLTFQRGDASAVPVEDGSFDVAVSTQVLEYVPDVPKAVAELHRVLRPGGRVFIVDTDWDAVVWHSSKPERMERILRAWEAHCADPRLPRTLAPKLRSAGFTDVVVSGYPIINTSFDTDTFSHGVVGLMRAFITRKSSLPAEELDAWIADLHTLDAERRCFFSTMRFFFEARKPSG